MKTSKAKAPLGASLVVLSSIFYASYGIWTKLMGNFFSGYTASALRSVLVLIMLLPVAVYLKKLQKLDLKHNLSLLLALIISSAFIWGPLYYAILHAGIGISLAINYAGIVIGMFFFGWLFFSEKFTKDKLVSSLLGFIGLAMIFIPGNAQFGWLALGASALSGFATSLNMTISKKMTYNATQSTVMLWVTSVIANTIMIFIVHEKVPQFSLGTEWLYLAAFALASVIASWAFVSGLRKIDAGAAGVLGLLEIVFGVIFGVAFFHEHPTGLFILGVLVIIVASAIPYIKDYDFDRGTLG